MENLIKNVILLLQLFQGSCSRHCSVSPYTELNWGVVAQSTFEIFIAFLDSLRFVMFALQHYFQTCKCAQRSHWSHVSQVNMKKKNKCRQQAGTDPKVQQLWDLQLCANRENKCLLTGKGPVERNTTSCQDSKKVLLFPGWHCQLVQFYYESHHILFFLFCESHGLRWKFQLCQKMWNHRLAWLGRDLKDHPVQLPWHGQGHPH